MQLHISLYRLQREDQKECPAVVPYYFQLKKSIINVDKKIIIYNCFNISGTK